MHLLFIILSRNSGFGGTVFRLGSGCMLSTADGVVLWLWPDRVFVTYLSNSYICCLSV